jgi:Mn-dependent DtxR family transcriptional regulator
VIGNLTPAQPALGSGPSNREIRDAAEINDSAQVSKLMKHLARLGLVENTGAGPLTGKAYAWRLTNTGTELLRELEGEGIGAAESSPPKRRPRSKVRRKAGARTRSSNGVAASNGHDRAERAKGLLQGVDPPISEREFNVLVAIGELNARGSGSSNHAIRDATEIKDQAEVSKLLKQLARRGLVESTATGIQTYGWRLTTKGTELLRELEGQTVGA